MLIMRWIRIISLTAIGFLIFLGIGIKIVLGVNPIWNVLDCGGIDPGFQIGCGPSSYGYKRSCLFIFICKKEPSQRPGLFL